MRAAAVALVAASLVGCGHAARVATHNPDAVDDDMCGLSAAQAQVIFSGSGAAKACAAFVRAEGSRGNFWTRHGRGARTARIVCELAGPGGLTLTVLDVGGAYVGGRVCADYAARGWRER